MGRGGDRRSKYNGKKTKVARIPEDLDADALVQLTEDLQTLVNSWKAELHPTSPRHERFKLAIDEVQKLLEGLKLEQAFVLMPKDRYLQQFRRWSNYRLWYSHR